MKVQARPVLPCVGGIRREGHERPAEDRGIQGSPPDAQKKQRGDPNPLLKIDGSFCEKLTSTKSHEVIYPLLNN